VDTEPIDGPGERRPLTRRRHASGDRAQREVELLVFVLETLNMLRGTGHGEFREQRALFARDVGNEQGEQSARDRRRAVAVSSCAGCSEMFGDTFDAVVFLTEPRDRWLRSAAAVVAPGDLLMAGRCQSAVLGCLRTWRLADPNLRWFAF
jgi:hypothetical protein